MSLPSIRGLAIFSLATLLTLPVSRGAIVALDTPGGLFGNQSFGGSLGMEFGVGLTPVRITRIGAFDSGQDGFANPINVRLYDRTNFSPLIAESLGPGPVGELVNGSRFVVPSISLTLPAGFRGAIVADGYSAAEPLHNSGFVGGITPTINRGGGALRFTGRSRYGINPGGYPDTPDGGPANRYNAGTFEFEAVGPVFHMAYDINPDLPAWQDYGGSLGLDFDVGASAIAVTHLGVFDAGGDGLTRPITAYIYDRDTQLPVLGPFTFSGDGDLLVNGARWEDIGDFELPAGFHGSMVAEGYGPGELLYNMGGDPQAEEASGLDDGDGAISFVGSGRFGEAGFFPGNPDGGPVNRYASGTFAFTVVPEPASLWCFAAAGAALASRRWRR